MLLKDIYQPVKNNFTDLTEITEQEITKLDEKIEKSHLRKETNRAILINYLAVSLLLIFPFIIYKTIRFFDIISNYLLAKQGNYDNDYIVLAVSSLCIANLGLVTYFFVMPNEKLRINRLTNTPPQEPINTRQKNYVRGRIIAIYLVVGALLYLTQLLGVSFSKWIILILKYYVGVPSAFAIFLILTVSVASLVLPLSRKLNKNRNISENRIELLFVLLEALHELEPPCQLFVMPTHTTNKIVRALTRASNLIRNYPAILNKSATNQIVNKSLNQSANFIDQVVIDFQTSNDIEAIKLRERLLTCTNIVLHGNLLDLPKLEIGEGDRIVARKAKVYHYILLAVYLTIPIISVIAINLFFKVKFSDYEQSLLKILYIVWAFVGVFSNPVILNSDNKELVSDIIKSWLGKS